MNPYITTLQTKVIEFLNASIKLLNNSDQILYRTYSVADDLVAIPMMDRLKNIEKLEQKIQDVIVFQIRMPIVASMKAGKSTIINAIIGGEYLPTRMDAMTALPTVVALKLGMTDVKDADRVQFFLTDKTIAAVDNLRKKVMRLFKELFSDDQKLNSLVQDNTHLVSTAFKLRDDHESSWILPRTLKNSQDIQKILTFINELVRLSIKISSNYPDLDLSLDPFLKDIPIIDVHHRAITDRRSVIKHPCQMLLIDTPGPNEAGCARSLQMFLQNELRRADMVLIVVEYGHINTEADAKITEYIADIRRLNRNYECIYVLVNKADLRKRKDMSKEALLGYVANVYNVPTHCVFELSGSHALIAQQYVTDYLRHGESIVLHESSTANDVLEAFCPIDWDERLTDSSPDEVETMARNLYRRSGLSNILDKVLDEVLGQVIQRCIQSATDTCKENNENLVANIDVRLKGLQLLEERLRQEINDLKNDLNDLAIVEQKELNRISEITNALEQELRLFFQKAIEEYEAGVQEIFNPMNKLWFDSAERERQDRETKNQLVLGAVLTTTLGATGGIGGYTASGAISAVVGTIVGFICGYKSTPYLLEYFQNDTSEVNFEDGEKAKEFIEGITDLLNNLSQMIYVMVQKEVTATCNETCTKFTSQLSQRTLQIIQRANEGLRKTFNIDPAVPQRLESKIGDIHIDLNDIGYEKERSYGFIRRLLTNEHNEDRKTWFLSRSKLQEKCLTSLKANMQYIEKDIVERTISEMKSTFKSLFTDLKAHLEKYQNYAAWCIKDKSLTQENQTKFIAQLSDLRKESLVHQQQMQTFTESIDWSKLV